MPNGIRATEMPADKRKAVFCLLLTMLDESGSELQRGSVGKVAKQFQMGDRAIRRVWERIRSNMQEHLRTNPDDERLKAEVPLDCGDGSPLNITPDLYPKSVFASGKKGKVGAKRKIDRKALEKALKDIPIKDRRSYRSLAKNLGIGSSTIHRLLKQEKGMREQVDIKSSIVKRVSDLEVFFAGCASKGPSSKRIATLAQTVGHQFKSDELLLIQRIKAMEALKEHIFDVDKQVFGLFSTSVEDPNADTLLKRMEEDVLEEATAGKNIMERLKEIEQNICED